jgi:amino acid permease
MGLRKSTLVAYAFNINFIVGAGVLGLPYSFMRSTLSRSPL